MQQPRKQLGTYHAVCLLDITCMHAVLALSLSCHHHHPSSSSTRSGRRSSTPSCGPECARGVFFCAVHALLLVCCSSSSTTKKKKKNSSGTCLPRAAAKHGADVFCCCWLQPAWCFVLTTHTTHTTVTIHRCIPNRHRVQ
jgi:hypothetical protein